MDCSGLRRSGAYLPTEKLLIIVVALGLGLYAFAATDSGNTGSLAQSRYSYIRQMTIIMKENHL